MEREVRSKVRMAKSETGDDVKHFLERLWIEIMKPGL